MMHPNLPTERRRTAVGFTRLELLIVLAMLALLGSLARPVWGNGGPSRGLMCMDNLRRLQAAWLVYAQDSQGALPGNYHAGFVPAVGARERPWATGWLDWAMNPDNTNTVILSNSRYCALAPYLAGDTSVFRCPADMYVTDAQAAHGWTARVRSYSMNWNLGEGNQLNGPSYDWTYPIIKRLGEFRSLSPQQTFVFAEEHPDSINDPLLWVNMTSPLWTDLPGSFHEGAGWFTFADGHLELHGWQQTFVRRPVGLVPYNNYQTSSADVDLIWVRAHTAAK